MRGFSSGKFALNKASRKLRRKLRRQPEAWLRKNVSKKIFRPAKEKQAPGHHYPMQTEPMPVLSSLLLMKAPDFANRAAGFWQASEDTMLYTSHLREIVFALRNAWTKFPKTKTSFCKRMALNKPLSPNRHGTRRRPIRFSAHVRIDFIGGVGFRILGLRFRV